MKYKVKSNLQHDKKAYAPGDIVELTEAQAAPLLPDVVEPVEKEDTRKKEAAKSTASTSSENEPEGPTYKELQEEAKSLGLPHVGVKRDDLVKSIAEKKAELSEGNGSEAGSDATAGTLSDNDENPGGDL